MSILNNLQFPHWISYTLPFPRHPHIAQSVELAIQCCLNQPSYTNYLKAILNGIPTTPLLGATIQLPLPKWRNLARLHFMGCRWEAIEKLHSHFTSSTQPTICTLKLDIQFICNLIHLARAECPRLLPKKQHTRAIIEEIYDLLT